ncbi:Type I restriction-modification system, DNA-methyltransferase subunit M [Fulvivirga imtechensis AK7]|uniref:site-specific DNA-methyltransferase (adenine-specific) n=1 Tax=Fulvivirga imtechensis AK7 TaxID=1237149 RepID=L8JPM8_9BACT|nr:N-6 DNA methylase [Fulvivirga imtechensis]ELR69322.1 Type I restriction-modification system, DNA-methyltransferase subunit M [Fulvivirga imtechensis AK7]
MLQNNAKLKSLIVSLWDTLWSSGIANPLTAIEQISYLLFIKKLDENEKNVERNIAEGYWTEKDYTLKFGGEYTPYVDVAKLEAEYKKSKDKSKTIEEVIAEARQPRKAEELRWSYFKNMSADAMLQHVRFNVFDFVKKLNSDTAFFTKHMESANFELRSPSLLVEAIKKIDEIYLEIEKDAEDGKQTIQDIQGDVYEMLLSEIATAGKMGQFRTPRHLIKLMAELVEPKLGNRIADPACGTGGFLIGAYQYILTDLVRKTEPSKLTIDEDGFESGIVSSILTPENKIILDQGLIGFDIDVTMVRLGLMNLMMHGINNPQIDYRNTLSKSYNEEASYDIVMANPPFTGKLDKGDINPDLKIDSTSTELLFLSRISKMLRAGGKAAVIIPEGVLFGSSGAQKATREMLLKDSQLEAVVSLPQGAFKPYTGVKTAILIFTKVQEDSKDWHTEKVWFYSVENDGYSLDDNRRKLKENPLPEIKTAFEARAKVKYENRKNHFFVELKEIQENELDLSYNRYKEYEYAEQKYDPPKEILEKLIQLEKEILEDMNELNSLIR